MKLVRNASLETFRDAARLFGGGYVGPVWAVTETYAPTRSAADIDPFGDGDDASVYAELDARPASDPVTTVTYWSRADEAEAHATQLRTAPPVAEPARYTVTVAPYEVTR